MTRSQDKERLTRLCSAYGKPFPFMIKGRRVEKAEKRYNQILPAVWKAEKKILAVDSINQVEEVIERKLWAVEKVTIPAGSAKLVKVRTEGNWRGAGFVESLPLEE